jgi:hypothetical protein
MSILSKDQIKANIQSELSDNNAGLISAYDVRHNMEDIVDSINQIVASGNFDATTPFTGSNVRAKIRNGQFGSFVAESGIIFPNAGGSVQYEAYPGATGVQHNSLANLAFGDPHTQYLNINGSRAMENNLGLKNNWINSSGSTLVSSNNRGISFEHLSGIAENVKLGSQTKVVFNSDNSSFDSAKGTARAWINFSGSGNIEVRDSFNVKQIERVSGSPGKFKITFVSGVLENNNYVAIGSSNARNDNDEGEDFDRNVVGLVKRIGDDATTLRSITFYVLNSEGNYVDAKVNDLVVFGRSKGATSGVPPTIIN